MAEPELRNRFEQVKDNISDGWVENEPLLPPTPPNSLADVVGEYMKNSIYVSDETNSTNSSEDAISSSSTNVEQQQEHEQHQGEDEDEEEETDDYDEEEDENRVILESSDEGSEDVDIEDPPVEYVIAEQEFKRRYEEECPSIILFTGSVLLILYLIRSICMLCLLAVRMDNLCVCRKF